MNEREQANGEEKKRLSCGRDWGELPPDVIMAIFMKTGIFEPEVLRAAGSVCRSWRKVAKEEPQLVRRIDITNHGFGCDAPVLMVPVRRAIDLRKGRLEEFAIEYLGDDGLLRFLCDRTSVLKKLCLISCYRISEEAIAETAKRQPLLEEINIRFGSFDAGATYIIGKECPQLKTFKFNDIWYDDDDDDIPHYVEIDSDNDSDDVDVELSDDEEAFGIANTMHQLRHLQLLGNSMTNRGLRAILNGCPHLETLDIRRCCNVNMDADMWALCARLKTMRLLEEDSLDDYQFESDDNHDLAM